MVSRMRFAPCFVCLLLVACGTDTRSMPNTGVDDSNNTNDDSDPGVDGGVMTDGGSTSTVADARVPPPDGIPEGLAPCDEAPYHSDFTFVQDKIFSVSCAVSGCHDSTTPSANMDLSAGRAYASLVNVPSSQYSGWMRVVPRSSPQSMLMVQVGGESGPELEGTMPWGQPKLCDPLIDAMRRWIVAGAVED
jgi:hypothetical protein